MFCIEILDACLVNRLPSFGTLFSNTLYILSSREVRDQSFPLIVSKIMILHKSIFRVFNTKRIDERLIIVIRQALGALAAHLNPHHADRCDDGGTPV
jgi:hypothetical protein